ncbi:hypothetical protein NPIL_169801 [Nephila pilipes]|uniref:Uncharacterized protein n=1 Tax=Nephila pilipes TaxID=299642 RepID=A0A8X6K089_NEPPI|nr:hypothetical protein NPIL_169801 [Nephila pilipes]
MEIKEGGLRSLNEGLWAKTDRPDRDIILLFVDNDAFLFFGEIVLHFFAVVLSYLSSPLCLSQHAIKIFLEISSSGIGIRPREICLNTGSWRCDGEERS